MAWPAAERARCARPRRGVAQMVPNLGEKREVLSGRQCTNRSAITASPSSGYLRKSSAISHLAKRLAPNSNPCLPDSLRLGWLRQPYQANSKNWRRLSRRSGAGASVSSGGVAKADCRVELTGSISNPFLREWTLAGTRDHVQRRRSQCAGRDLQRSNPRQLLPAVGRAEAGNRQQS